MATDSVRYRILLIALPRIAEDMVHRTVAAHEDVLIVGRADSHDGLTELANSTNANVVVTGVPARGLPAPCHTLMLDRPGSKVIGVAQDDGRGYLYVLRPEELELGELSPEDIVRAIRSPAARQCAA
jgi:hypothetical protein